MFGMMSSAVYDEFTSFCKEHNVPLLDYYASQAFVNNKEYFSDSNHLNDTGAREYTKAVAKEVREIFAENN